jgi:quinoprotein glucose dehydrogenase
MKRIALTTALAIALATSGCLTSGMDLPIGVRVMAELYLGWGLVSSRVFPTRIGAPEGMEDSVFRDLGDVTAVGLDVAADGDVFVAISNRQRAGVSDNRFKSYWLLDDLAAKHVDDRRAYIEKWAERGKDPLSWYTAESDEVWRLRDLDGDGAAEEQRSLASFNDVLTGIGSAVLAHGDQVYFTDVPDLYLLRDADDDGSAEDVEILAHGFGISTSLGGHDLHGLVWGPDGRIYFSMGDRGYNVETHEGHTLRPPMVVTRGAVFRMQPDGSQLEVFATGLRNPQDLAFDAFGNLFTGDNNADGADEARLVYVVEGSDSGWAMPVQSMEGEYLHGPWEAERLWELQHEGQPAWVHPPIGYVARGPAGAAIDPGLGGLPEQFRGQILIADYQYTPARSGIHAYSVAPDGAGFEMTGKTPVFEGLLPTDLAFGPDGRIYVSDFSQFQEKSAILRFEDPKHLADPRVAELAALLREGFAQRPREELVELLGHVDQRARRGAQHELVARTEARTLGEVTRDLDAPLLARVHAMWGLGQLGADALASAGLGDFDWTRFGDLELRAQAMRLLGEARAASFLPELIGALAPDETPRVQGFAARSLGQLADPAAVEPLLELLRRNDDGDVVLRLRAVHALAEIGDLDALLAHADDPSPAVRRGILLVLRRHEDPRIARFMSDPDTSLVVEAARAIHDCNIEEALPALAALAGRPMPLVDDDPQSSYALHRRVLSANLTLGGAAHADAIAAHAADAGNPQAMRAEALEVLAEFTRPAPRERVFGFHRVLAERPTASVHSAIDVAVPALLGTPLESRALEIALAYGRVPLPDDQLLARLEGWFTAERIKRASLRVLADRDSLDLGRGLAAALDSRSPALRADARDVLAEKRPAAAIESIHALGRGGALVERQRAYATLARLASPEADAILREDLASLRAGDLEPGVRLDLLEAAAQRGEALGPELSAYTNSLDVDDPLAAREPALYGGDTARGRIVFEGAGDCMRCHNTAGGHGGRAGPDLAGIGKRQNREYFLESILLPQAQVAQGYGTVGILLEDGTSVGGTLIEEDGGSVTLEVAGDRRQIPRRDIADLTGPVSGMPPMGAALTPYQLRDLIEYLGTL